MHPDYIHNPPNMRPPVHKYFYLIMFINNKNYQMKGQAVIYRRKTVDMLLDLINDLDDVYFYSDCEGDKLYLAEQTRNIDCYFRVFYTANFYEVLNKINPQAYLIKYAWNEIPNCNPIPFPAPPHNHHPFPHAVHPHQYINTKPLSLDTDQLIEAFGDQE